MPPRVNEINTENRPKPRTTVVPMSPSKLGESIFEEAGKHVGAVGQEEFDTLIKQITPKNVKDVLIDYTKEESLINTITSEYWSDKQKRKDAVMHIYDALAQSMGTNPSVRAIFLKELNDQFDSFGVVNTKKLDRIIQDMMLSPKELAIRIYETADSKSGAVGKEEFDILIKMIGQNNVEEVLVNYPRDKSLIKTIINESWSDKQKRMDAVMHVFDALARAKDTPPSIRSLFISELASFGSSSIKDIAQKLNITDFDTTKLDMILDNMKLTPQSLGEKLYSVSSKKYGAVGEEEFDILVELITPKNVEEVLRNYTGKESLIYTITTEVFSDKEKRRDAALHVFEALAQAKDTPASVREKFVKELNVRLFDCIGVMNTTNLDRIMSDMQLSPEKLGKRIYDFADDNSAAIGKEEFDTLIELITPKNIVAVLKNYPSQESLIYTLTTEVLSDKEKRKNAATYIFDTLAQTRKVPSSKREEFIKELNVQFGKFIGMVDTAKMDDIISGILNSKN